MLYCIKNRDIQADKMNTIFIHMKMDVPQTEEYTKY